MRVSGTAAIVTGGASGLGGATARALAEAGARVYAVDLAASIKAAPEVTGVTYALYENLSPGYGYTAIAVALLAFAVYFTLLAVTTLIFRRAGTERAFALGLMVSQRNLGLMLAATAGALPQATWLYFAMTQFPIHLAPYLLMPIARLVLEDRLVGVLHGLQDRAVADD